METPLKNFVFECNKCGNIFRFRGVVSKIVCPKCKSDDVIAQRGVITK